MLFRGTQLLDVPASGFSKPCEKSSQKSRLEFVGFVGPYEVCWDGEVCMKRLIQRFLQRTDSSSRRAGLALFHQTPN